MVENGTAGNTNNTVNEIIWNLRGKRFKRKDIICERGDPASRLLLCAGAASIDGHNSEKGNWIRIPVVAPAVIGEEIVAGKALYAETITAFTECYVRSITPESSRIPVFQSYLDRLSARQHLWLQKSILDRKRPLEDQIISLFVYLSTQSSRFGKTHLTNDDIGEFLGCTRETVNKVLREKLRAKFDLPSRITLGDLAPFQSKREVAK